MTIINIRNADGFSVTDNFYQIPDSMSVDDAKSAIRFCVSGSAELFISGAADWAELDAELATMGIIPASIHTVDVEF